MPIHLILHIWSPLSLILHYLFYVQRKISLKVKYLLPDNMLWGTFIYFKFIFKMLWWRFSNCQIDNSCYNLVLEGFPWVLWMCRGIFVQQYSLIDCIKANDCRGFIVFNCIFQVDCLNLFLKAKNRLVGIIIRTFENYIKVDSKCTKL